jgi:hypothetical protein
LVPPVYRVAEHTVNWLCTMREEPKNTCEDVVPRKAVTKPAAPCPLARTVVNPEPDKVAVLPLPLASAHVPAAMSNSPARYHAFVPAGRVKGKSGEGGGAGGDDADCMRRPFFAWVPTGRVKGTSGEGSAGDDGATCLSLCISFNEA